MDNFENVTIVKKANLYFEGLVSSRTVIFANGEKKTLGVMLPGEYKFNTAAKEIMEILAGKLFVKLLGEDDFTEYNEGSSFEVPSNSSFELLVKTLVDYCCSYISQ